MIHKLMSYALACSLCKVVVYGSSDKKYIIVYNIKLVPTISESLSTSLLFILYYMCWGWFNIVFVPLFAAWEGRVWRVRRDKCRIAGNWGRMNCNVILCDHKICSIDMCWNTCFKFTWTMEQVEGKLSMFQIRDVNILIEVHSYS